ncbi:ImmA/IrrE family metallo-endopeptidase [Marinobacter sp. Arc7-DN-1]|uniref:ImmA/IrrE family metallo-endopeptidase n=1 Tax=Marinobacter sp. Arc7-DN-1 TaxID=2304594 RepID=UPI000E43F5AF|nr:ImmA/IrrE family metallo-endopeptidase [Marinobacter sp. Arc7-DN-1]AXS84541.1 ImmA/IrrE family metallo-endopeptidase [Marinobacter sp. Arc7-DN-1]
MKFKRAPEHILREIGIDSPDEIDLDLIAFDLNAVVKRDRLPGCEGQIVGTDTRAIITINNESAPQRQRFSLGHEIGHWINDRGKNLSYRCTDSDMRQHAISRHNFKQQKEVRANRFSAELLMPGYLLKRYLPAREISVSTVNYLSQLFDVSRTSASIRLVEVSDLPCMLVCWDKQGRRKWFSRNPIVPDSIWPHRQILRPHEVFGESNALTVDADRWIDGAAAANSTITESQYTNGYDLFSLIWWPDESALNQEPDE